MTKDLASSLSHSWNANKGVQRSIVRQCVIDYDYSVVVRSRCTIGAPELRVLFQVLKVYNDCVYYISRSDDSGYSVELVIF